MALESRPSISAVLLVVLSGAVLLSVITSYPNGIDWGRKEEESREKAAFVLFTPSLFLLTSTQGHYGPRWNRLILR
jgi:hypothetical protein